MNKKVILIIIGSVISLIACNNHKDNVSPQPGPNNIRTLADTVFLFDEFGNKLGDKSGVIVRLYVGTDTLRDTTTSSGEFSFSNIDFMKNYSITFQKPGFGSYKKLNVGSAYYIGGANLQEISTTRPFNLTIDSIYDSNSSGYFFNGNITPSGSGSQARNVRLYFGLDTTVSSTNYVYTILSDNCTSNTFYFSEVNYDLVDKGLTPGGKVYAIAYGDAISSNPNFFQYKDENGKIIYPSINPIHSNIVVFRLRPRVQ